MACAGRGAAGRRRDTRRVRVGTRPGCAQLRVARVDPAPFVMMVRVVRDEVAISVERSHDAGPRIERLPDNEERSLGVIPVENGGHRRSRSRIRPVVKGDRDQTTPAITVADATAEPAGSRCARTQVGHERADDDDEGGADQRTATALARRGPVPGDPAGRPPRESPGRQPPRAAASWRRTRRGDEPGQHTRAGPPRAWFAARRGRRQAGTDPERDREEHGAHGVRSLRHQPCRDEGDAGSEPGEGRAGGRAPGQRRRQQGRRETERRRIRASVRPSWATASTQRRYRPSSPGIDATPAIGPRAARPRRLPSLSNGAMRSGRCTDAYSRRTEWKETDGKTSRCRPAHPLPGGTFVLCLVVVAWAITLTRYLWHASCCRSTRSTTMPTYGTWPTGLVHGRSPCGCRSLAMGRPARFPTGSCPGSPRPSYDRCSATGR